MGKRINRLKKLNYQFLNSAVYSRAAWTDADYVKVANSLVNAQLDDLSLVIDIEMPASVLNCTIDWPTGFAPNDSVYKVIKGSFQEIQDANYQTLPESAVFNPSDNQLGLGNAGYTAYLGTF